MKAIKSLKFDCLTSCDNIPANFVRPVAEYLAFPMTDIINNCINAYTVPSECVRHQKSKIQSPSRNTDQLASFQYFQKSFSNLQAASWPIFKELNILPIPSTIFSLNIILAHKTLNLESPKSVQETLGLLHRQNPFPTRSADIKLLERPTVRTTNFGYKSIRYKTIKSWNTLQTTNRNVDLSICSTLMIKQFISKFLDLMPLKNEKERKKKINNNTK